MSYVVEDIKGWYKRSGIPHYDCDKVYQFITFRLYDSVPEHVIDHLKDELSIKKETDKNSKEYQDLQRTVFKYEDNGFGKCFLKNTAVYQVVEEAFYYFDGEKYDLIEFVIMPNHVHLLIRPHEGQSLSKTIQSWKRYTAKKANQILNRKGKFWMNDYYDRYIRNEVHFLRVVAYIKNNGKSRER